jgi:hypothetical protein
MLTTKSKIAEQILRRLSKFTDESRIDERELMLSTHQALGSLLRVRFFESKSVDFQEIDGSVYYTISDNSVLKDDTRSEYYTNMPSTSISLPYGVDIKRVGTARGRGFVEAQLGFNDLYVDLPSFSLEGNIGYYREGARLYYVNMTASNNPSSVNITMTLPLDNIDEDDELNLPADMVGEIVEIVFEKYLRTLGIPHDEENNSIDR